MQAEIHRARASYIPTWMHAWISYGIIRIPVLRRLFKGCVVTRRLAGICWIVDAGLSRARLISSPHGAGHGTNSAQDIDISSGLNTCSELEVIMRT